MNCTFTNQSSSSSRDEAPRGLLELGLRRRSRSTWRGRRASPRASWRGRARGGRRGRCRRPCAPCPSRAPSRAAAGSRRRRSPRAPRRPTAAAGRAAPRAAPSGGRRCAESTRKPREPLACGGFMQTSRSGIAELLRRRAELLGRARQVRARRLDAGALGAAPSSAPCRRRRRSPRTRRPSAASRRARGWRRTGRPRRSTAGRRRRRPRARASSATAGANSSLDPGGTTWKLVAEEAPAAALAHVGADHGELALAVLLQRPDQPRGSGRARGREQDAQRPQRHTTHRTTSKHSANGRPISMPCVRARLRMYSSFA